MGTACASQGGPRVLDGVERRRPGPARRSDVLDRWPGALVRTHRRRRGSGPDTHAVADDRPACPVRIDHRAGRPRPGHRTVDLCRLGGDPSAPSGDGALPSRRADPRLPGPRQGARFRLAAAARRRSRHQPHRVHTPRPERARRAHRGSRCARHRRVGRGPHALGRARVGRRHHPGGVDPGAHTPGPARPRCRGPGTRRHDPAHHDRPCPSRQGPRVRRRRGR